MNGLIRTALRIAAIMTAAVVLQAQEEKSFLPLNLSEEWTLFCPETGVDELLDPLTAIPAELGNAKAQKIRFDQDYSCTIPRTATVSGPAILMNEFEAEKDGYMQAGGGADWFWNVRVNGVTVFDRMKQGNAFGPITFRNHQFYFPVKKGKNLLIATVIRGANGWKFAMGPVPFRITAQDLLADEGYGTVNAEIDGIRFPVSPRTGEGKNFKSGIKLKSGENAGLDVREIRDRKGNYGLRLTLDSAAAEALPSFQIQLPAKPFANSTINLGGKEFPLPSKKGEASVFECTPVVIEGANHQLTLSGKALSGKITATETGWLLQCRTAAEPAKKILSQLTLIPGVPPFKITQGADWVKLAFGRDILPGSILDFSFFADAQAPAGKFGRVIPGKDGHFVFEKTGERARLLGANLCFGANYISKEECDHLAQVFRRQGYNSVRFHHTDVGLIKGDWNAQTSYEINEDALDKFDYLFAAMKKAGMYITIDFYTMRFFGVGEIDEIKRRVMCDVKAILPVSDSAFRAWGKLVVSWMNHVNPYTGIAWKDDPALVFACPMNEDTIYSVLNENDKDIMALYLRRYAEWKEARGITTPDLKPIKKDPNFTRFLVELKRDSNRKIAQFIKDQKIPVPLSGSNWWNTMAQTFTRSEFDVVDNHQYADHPSNNSYNQNSNVNTHGSVGRLVPTFMTPTRIYGKPFTVTEYNFCFPNQYRAEGGTMFGAYCALQDWDALYRFAWSHDSSKSLRTPAISHFDIASDLLNLFTDKQIALLFTRGDVKPALKRYLYAVTMKEAVREGCGGMWAGGLFPASFSALSVLSHVGSQVVEGDVKVQGTFDGVAAEVKPGDALLNGNPYLTPARMSELTKPDENGNIASDTREIVLNTNLGQMKVVTDQSECIVSYPLKDGAAITGNALSVAGNTTFSAISASAMDSAALRDSRRVLLFHLTNVLNENMKFSNKEMRRIEAIGDAQLLVRTGMAQIVLKNSNPGLILYAVDFSGKRIREVKTDYRDGAYRFTVRISPDEEAVMAYELTAK